MRRGALARENEKTIHLAVAEGVFPGGIGVAALIVRNRRTGIWA